METEDGKSYTLEIDNDTSGAFQLTIPNGVKIRDNFNDFTYRKYLYLMLEIVITMKNSERYVLTVNKSSGMCKLEYPERVVEFYKDNIYIESAELPLLYEGRLNERLRERLKKMGVSIPSTPYELGFKAIQKND